MKFITVKFAILTFCLTALFSTTGLSAVADDQRAPEVPCVEINAPAGNKVAFKAYAAGVQVYRWNGTAWALVGPVANLYANAGLRGKIGTHYAGPTWESNSGSTVVGRRVNSCPVDANSIPWLLLEAFETDGPGIFSKATYIQRVNTQGGLAPSGPGGYTGEEVSIPYTAEYYFYRKSNQ